MAGGGQLCANRVGHDSPIYPSHVTFAEKSRVLRNDDRASGGEVDTVAVGAPKSWVVRAVRFSVTDQNIPTTLFGFPNSAGDQRLAQRIPSDGSGLLTDDRSPPTLAGEIRTSSEWKGGGRDG